MPSPVRSSRSAGGATAIRMPCLACSRASGPSVADHRALGPHLPAGRQPRPRHRLPGRGRALVGSVAERPGHRRHARAHAAGLRRGPSGARDDDERSSRGAWSARRSGRAPTSESELPASGPGGWSTGLRAREPRGPLATLDRDRGRRVDGNRRRGRASGRPALDDGLSLCFDSEPVSEPIELLGNPVVELDLASDRPQAQIGIRLCDVSPDGSSLRVSYAVLNLCAIGKGRRHRSRWFRADPSASG